MKKIISIALAVLLIATMIPMTVFAAGETKATDIVDVTGKTEITLGGVTYKVVTTAAEITDPAGNYYLANDLTLSAVIIDNFTGKFNGGGKVITLNGAVTVFGGTIGGADTVVSNFTVKGADVTLGQYAGILAPNCTMGGYYYNITNEVNITSADTASSMMIGGILGAISDAATANTTIEKCVNKGNITSNKSVTAGIIAGSSTNPNNTTITIIDCSNSGVIKAENYAAGIVGGNLGSKVNFVIDGCSNTANISGVAVTAGIVAGNGNGTTTNSTFKITDCYNTGNISSTNNAIGGIFGGTWNAYSVQIEIANCYNKGNIATTNNFGAGGILGYFNGPKAEHKLTVTDCVNYGDIAAKSSFVAGIVGGSYATGYNPLTVKMDGCVNFGNVSVSAASTYVVAGVVSMIRVYNGELEFRSCANFGNVTGVGQNLTAGVISLDSMGAKPDSTDKSKIVIADCYNAGTVTNADRAPIALVAANIYTGSTGVFVSDVSVENGYSVTLTDNVYSIGGSEGLRLTVADTVGATTLDKMVKAVNAFDVLEETLYVKDGAVAVCTNHSFANGACSVCGAADPNYVAPNPPAQDPVTPPAQDPVTPPATSDVTVFAIVIATVALAGVCVAKKKIKE